MADSKDNWDYYCARICSVIQLGPIYVAFYDGSKAQNENYEEKTGIAVGLTLDSFYRSVMKRIYSVSELFVDLLRADLH